MRPDYYPDTIIGSEAEDAEEARLKGIWLSLINARNGEFSELWICVTNFIDSYDGLLRETSSESVRLDILQRQLGAKFILKTLEEVCEASQTDFPTVRSGESVREDILSGIIKLQGFAELRKVWADHLRLLKQRMENENLLQNLALNLSSQRIGVEDCICEIARAIERGSHGR